MTRDNRNCPSWRDQSFNFKGYTNPHKPNENNLPPPIGVPSFKFASTQNSTQSPRPPQDNNSAQGNNSSSNPSR